MNCKNLLNKILDTDPKDYSLLILRIALWIFIFAHGWQKMFWLFWGNWFDATMWFFTGKLWLPYIIAILVILWESFWAIVLMLWLKTRIMAFSMLIILIWAVYMVHWKNWFYDFELHFLWIAISIALIIKWWWACSLDLFIKKFLNKKLN